MSDHYSVDLYPDDEGWFHARCNCGWEAPGVYPTAEDACDALMDHAYEAGAALARLDATTTEQQR